MLGISTLEKLVQEAASLLTGKEVARVSPAGDFPDDLLIFFREIPGEKGFEALRIAFSSERARANLEKRPGPPGKSPANVQSLDHGLRGKKLERMYLYNDERILIMEFSPGPISLVAELFGKGNWFLLDEKGRILSLSRETRGKRALSKGTEWVPPEPAGKPPGRETPDPLEGIQEDINEKAEEYFRAMDAELLLERERQAKERLLRRALKKAGALVENLSAELEETGKAGEIRKKAELLKANLGRLKRGMTHIDVQDFYDPDMKTLRISIDPSKEPRETMEDLFKKARKLERGRPKIEARLELARKDMDILEKALKELEETGRTDLDTLARRLYFNSLGKELSGEEERAKEEKERKKKQKKGLDFRVFESREGMTILVGKNDEQNHLLSFVIGKGNDVWMHVGAGFQGSHVLIRVPRNKTPSPETLVDAAHLAAYFSKARGKKRIEVIYTRKKFLQRPRHAPKGRVIVTRHKTLNLEFEKERLDFLLQKSMEG